MKKGSHLTEEHRKHISESEKKAQKGNTNVRGKHWHHSDLAKKHMGDAHRGKHLSDIAKLHISESLLKWSEQKPTYKAQIRMWKEFYEEHHSNEIK
jgi:hypothetical protein